MNCLKTSPIGLLKHRTFSASSPFIMSWILLFTGFSILAAREMEVQVKQITEGPNHHFFGYIGHVQTIPWNASGRYILSLEVGFHDHMPTLTDAARIVLIDREQNNKIIPVDETRAWNFQQGTMFYWNPEVPETQFFFNDRDTTNNHIFAVLYDIEKRKRIKEYRYEDTPVGNSGIAQKGGKFLAINYGRLARLRPVTGYPGAYDWTIGEMAPTNDGVFIIDIKSGEKKLLVSFQQLVNSLKSDYQTISEYPLFINHTLWNREDDLIYFFVRAGYLTREKNVNTPCTIRPDGTGLTSHKRYGGHPEWIEDDKIIGSHGDDQIIYSIPEKKIVGKIGNPEILPKTGGDTAMSPDMKWIAVSWKDDGKNYYVIFRRSDMAYVHTPGFDRGGWLEGELRVDPAPRWNRTNDTLLVPGAAKDGTRQLFIIHVTEKD
jgi:hypothetical protein